MNSANNQRIFKTDPSLVRLEDEMAAQPNP